MSHTPGPWHWEADSVKGDCFNRIRYRVTAVGKTITQVYYSSFEGGTTNAENDARLIAAAPELLQCLEALLKVCDEELDPKRTPEMREARAAIKRAKGEA